MINTEPTKEQKNELWKLCSEFIKDNMIDCGKTVYRQDHVIENAYELIEQICIKIGYYNEVEEDEIV